MGGAGGNMKQIIIRKLLEGKYIELREYQLKEPLRVIYGDHQMIFTVAMLKKGKVVNKLQSKFPPYSYDLIYKFLWKPKIEEKEIVSPTTNDMFGNLTQEQRDELRKRLHS